VQFQKISLLVVIMIIIPGYLRAADLPRVVVSLKPLHALIAGVMEGVAKPELLLTGGESPHSYALRPSQAKLLAEADVIFWVGPELESFLVKPLQSLVDKGQVVTLLEALGVRLLPARRGGVWEVHDDHGEKMHKHGHEHRQETAKAASPPARQGMDPHLWLDPQNAKGIAHLAAVELGRLFPAHRSKLAANAESLAVRLDALDAELHHGLSDLRGRPFVVFHDAYQYFEVRYSLSAAGAITLSPEQAPGAQRLREIRKTIRERQATCVFAEPQFEPRLVATAVEGSGARQGVLDPLGADLKAGPDAYFVLMRRLAAGLLACLETP
jgi:zinc transport system substrate-binding protein